MKRIRALVITLLEAFTAEVRTFFGYNLSRTVFFEFIFASLTGSLIVLSYTNILGNFRYHIIFVFLLWAFLAMQGFFIPHIRESWTVGLGGDLPNGKPGVPFHLTFIARGGFIAGRKVTVKVRVGKIDDKHDTREEFKRTYEEVTFPFFNSIALPIKIGRFLEGQPEAGGVKVTPEKVKDSVNIAFNSPGEYTPMCFFKRKNDSRSYGGPLPKTLVSQKLTISAAEAWVGLRNYAITYALTLVILMLTLVQLRLI